jgi:hypothetical protein
MRSGAVRAGLGVLRGWRAACAATAILVVSAASPAIAAQTYTGKAVLRHIW